MTTQQGKADYLLLSYYIIWLVFGLIMLTSASSPVGHERFQDNYFYIKRQLLYGVLPGVVVFLFFAKLNYQKLIKLSWPIFVLMNFLLLLVFIPNIGSNLNTFSHSWIKIGNFTFQPSELTKLAVIVFLSAYLSNIGKKITDLKQGFIPALLLVLLPVILIIIEPDTGTVAIVLAIIFSLLFFAGTKLWHIGIFAAIGLVALSTMVMLTPYRAARLTTFLHPELDPQGVGYHINQAYLAIGSGGFFGLGLGHSQQKFQYLPEVHADSIFAVIAEEMGFLFSFGLVILIVLIGCRGFMIAKKADTQFGSLLAAGITTWFLIQSFMNIGAMVGILPLTGVPLPFISHGGTALLVSMAGVGILINISREAKV